MKAGGDIPLEGATLERSFLDEKRENLDKKIEDVINRAIRATAHREPVKSVLESIAEESFKEGYGRDTLIRKFAELRIFAADGIVAEELQKSIKHELDQHYASLGYDKAGGQLDKVRKKLINQALKIFLRHMSSDDCITSFFQNLIEGRYGLHKPLLVPLDLQGSVSKSALLEWALSPQTLGHIASRMGEFVKPVTREAYQVYIGVNPDQYVAAFFNNVIGIDKEGSVKIYFDKMNELIRDVCPSIDFEIFWRILMNHKDLLAKEYHEKFPGQRFYAAWIEDWKDYLEKRWVAISGEEGVEQASNSDVASEAGVNGKGGGAIRAARVTTAASVRRICSTILPPGAIDNGGSGSKTKAQVILTLPAGQKVDKFFVKTDMLGDLTSLRNYVRGKLINPNSSVAQALKSCGIHLEARADEIDTIVNSLIAAGSNKVKGIRMKRFPNSNGRH